MADTDLKVIVKAKERTKKVCENGKTRCGRTACRRKVL